MPNLKLIKIQKRIALFLAALTCLTFLASCGNGGNDTSSESSDISAPQDEKTGITVTIGGVSFEADALNRAYDGYDVVLYDRNYTENGVNAMYAPGDSAGRFVVIVKRSVSNGEESYTVQETFKNEDAKTGVYIPVNGFVISINYPLITEEMGVRLNQRVEVAGYDEKPEYEKLDMTTVIPEDKSKARRVNMGVPENGKFSEGKIYYVTGDDTVTVPEKSVAVLLESGTGSNYTIKSIAGTGETVSGTFALLFTGEYNVKYANEFYKEGKVYFARLDKLNNITDTAAVKIGDSYYPFEPDHINTSAGADGIYLYTPENSSLVTDGRESFIDVVVLNGMVCYIGAENARTLIPASHGFTLSFAGNAKELGKDIAVGDEIPNLLINDYANPDRFVRINGTNYEFTAVNATLSASNSAVLYTGLYGTSTGTGSDCVEIAFKDGKVVEVSASGDTVIPEGGYVLAVPYANTKLYASAKKVSVSDSVLVSFAGNNYGYSSFGYTTVNGVRYTDYIVIYNGKAGKTTGTNIYGFEVGVNAEGKMTTSSYAGNMTIPEGGFVISVHGDANVAMLSEIYSVGANVSYDTSTKTVSIYKTPDLTVYAAAVVLDEQTAAFENAKKKFYSIDYADISDSFKYAETNLAEAHNAYNSRNIDKAIELASCVSSALETLRFKLYESTPVENRATWYRANEKSDADVLKTVKLMAEMNINAIYIETWYNGEVIGFSDNELIGHHTAAHGDYDALEGFCRIGHEYGIEIHIWVENFFIGTPGGNLVNATTGHHLLDKKGRNYYPNMYGNFVFLNPYEEYSQNLVMDVYREIVENYDIDGIHLDYIRFLNPNSEDGADFGYNDDIIAGFQAAYNTTANPRTMAASGTNWDNWCLFRENIINDWVAKVYAMAKELKPSLKITSAVASDYPACRKTIYQNFNAWVEDGYMDEVFSMSYCANLEWPASNIKTFTAYTDGKAFYSIGLSAFELSPDYILVGQVQVARDNGAFGENLFSWGSLIINSENYFDALKAGVYSQKSVQTYKLSLTVAAYASRLIDDLDKVYAYLAPLPQQDDFYTAVKAKAEAILGKAKDFDLENSTDAQKAAYCNAAVADLEDLIIYINTCTNPDVSKTMTEDVRFILDCLNTSLVRIGK